MDIFKIGFIGCGNMAAAIINGVLEKKLLSASNISVYDIDKEKAACFQGVTICHSIGELAEKSEIIFLCVKPNIVQQVSQEIVASNKAVISIAAGVKVEKLASYLPADTRVMRIMPNTPMMIGKGAISIQTPNNLTVSEQSFVYSILKELGSMVEVGGNQMDAVTGVAGSGPAYVYLFVDALATAGEANGLNRETALNLAIQTFEGACAMLKAAKKEPEQLIKDVCSPGGTTIEAMKVFEQQDVRGIIKNAVDACVKRSKELSE